MLQWLLPLLKWPYCDEVLSCQGAVSPLVWAECEMLCGAHMRGRKLVVGTKQGVVGIGTVLIAQERQSLRVREAGRWLCVCLSVLAVCLFGLTAGTAVSVGQTDACMRGMVWLFA